MEVVEREPESETTTRKTGFRWWTIIVVVLIGVGGFAIFKNRTTEALAIATAETVPASERRVFALGRLEPEGEVIAVSAPGGASESRIESLEVSEGDRVKKGDVLAVLDTERRLKAAVRVARDTVNQSGASLVQMQREVETTRQRLEASLRMAEMKRSRAEQKMERFAKALQTSSVSKEAFSDAEVEAQTARETIVEARSRLDRYESVDGEEIADIRVERQKLAVAKASLEQTEATLEQAYIVAPIDGTILDVELRPGERVGQSSLLDMGATDRMMARVEVYESDVHFLELGQAVRFSAAALSTPLKGNVERISNYVHQQEIVDSNPAANTDARVVEVLARLSPDSSRIAAQYVNLQVRAEFVK